MPNRRLPWGSWICVYTYLFCTKMTLQVAEGDIQGVAEVDRVQGRSLPEKSCGCKKEVLEQPGLSLCPPFIVSVSLHFPKAGHCPPSLQLLCWFLEPPPLFCLHKQEFFLTTLAGI